MNSVTEIESELDSKNYFIGNNILAIDTGNRILTVSKFIGAEVVTMVAPEENRHQELLGSVNEFIKDLDFRTIIFNNGPGSYTGLRIGHSYVQGLCFETSVNIIPVADLTCIAGYFFKSNNIPTVVLKRCRDRKRPNEQATYWYALVSEGEEILELKGRTEEEIYSHIIHDSYQVVLFDNYELRSPLTKKTVISRPISEYLLLGLHQTKASSSRYSAATQGETENSSPGNYMTFASSLPNYGSQYKALTIRQRAK